MADLLPSSPAVQEVADDHDPRVVGVDSEDADALIAALSSTTARALLTALHEEPTTPAELADVVDTSLQNAQYHLEKLETADLIEVADTCYSEKGREMNVYAPTDGPLVVFAGSEDDATGLKEALSRVLGATGVLAVASLVVQRLFGIAEPEPAQTFSTQSGDSGAMESADTAESVEMSQQAAEAVATLEPGALFFLGGLLVVVLAGTWWYYVNSRHD